VFRWRRHGARGNSLTDDAGEGGGGGGVEALGHAAGEESFVAGDDGVTHGFGHEDGVGGFRDGGIHEDAVRAQFHGHGGIGGGADSCVYDHGNFGDAFSKDAEIGGILNAQSGADGRGKGHDGGGTGVNEFAGGDEVVVGVRKDDEAFLDEDFGGFDELFGVREKGLLVADDFEFDPVGEADFAGEARGADGFVGAIASRGVGKDKDFVAVDVVEEGFLGLIGEIDAADGDGDHIGAGSGVGAGHFGEAAVLPCSDDKTGIEGTAGDDELIGH
jgi:hypothetical protein